MSSFYLLSLFNDSLSHVVNPDPITNDAEITGNYVIRVADDVVVHNPTSVSDLLNQKHASMLASMGLFGQILYDDLLDVSGVNTASSTGVTLGSKGMISLFSGGQLVSSPSGFTWSGSGSGPSDAMMTWEIFTYVDTDSASSAYIRKYQEVPTSVAPITAEISFNGGGNWQTVTDKSLITVPPASQGTNLIVRFNHTGPAISARYFVGSWAVLF